MSRCLILWASADSANLGVRVLADGNAAIARHLGLDDVVHVNLGDEVDGLPLRRQEIVRELARPGRLSRWIRKFDLVIDSGAGDSFTDAYGMERYSVMCLFRMLAIRSKVPVVLGPQTVGPFKRRFSQGLARVSVHGVAAVMARDPISADVARSLRAKTIPSTDVVFGLDVSSAAPVDGLVGINASGLLASKSRQHRPRYRTDLSAVVERLRSERDVVLVPHVLGNDPNDSDTELCRELSTELDVPLAPIESLSDVRDALRRCSVVVGARMHACLNSVSQGVPAVPWAYSRKFKPLFDSLGYSAVLDVDSLHLVDETLSWISNESLTDMSNAARERGRLTLLESLNALRGAL